MADDRLSLYHAFYTAANTESISRAAQKLYVSQPSLSKTIHRLEEELDATLFIRTSRGIRLTEEGLLLYDYIKPAMESIFQGEYQLRQMKDMGIGELRIGVSTTLCKYRLLPYLKEFARQNPQVRISIHCQSSNQTMELLEQNKIDIGLVTAPENAEKYDFWEIEEIEDIFVATSSYMDNLKALQITTLTDTKAIFESASVMLLDKKNKTRQYVDAYLIKNNIEAKNLLVVTTMDLLIEFAKTGLGIGCVIREFVKDELKSQQLIEIPLGIPMHKRRIGFAARKQMYIPSAVSAFINYIA